MLKPAILFRNINCCNLRVSRVIVYIFGKYAGKKDLTNIMSLLRSSLRLKVSSQPHIWVRLHTEIWYKSQRWGDKPALSDLDCIDSPDSLSWELSDRNKHFMIWLCPNSILTYLQKGLGPNNWGGKITTTLDGGVWIISKKASRSTELHTFMNIYEQKSQSAS